MVGQGAVHCVYYYTCTCVMYMCMCMCTTSSHFTCMHSARNYMYMYDMIVYSCTRFSGQFESYLFQKGKSKVVESIKKCWCSCFSERVMSHRLDCGLPTTGLKMAVVIRVYVCAGVMINGQATRLYLNCDPFNHRRFRGSGKKTPTFTNCLASPIPRGGPPSFQCYILKT